MPDRYIQILAELSKHGIEQQIDIREFIIKVFDGVAPSEAHGYLDHMVLNRHIRFNYNPFDEYPHNLICALSLEGSEYLTSFYLKEATLQSFKNQKWVNRITWLISCLSIGIAVYFGLKSNSLETQVKELQKKVDTITKKTDTKHDHIPKAPDTLPKTLPKKK